MNPNQHKARRTWVARALCSAMSLSGMALPAWADEARKDSDYPSRAITIVVPNPPGSATDTLARIIAEGLNTAWKQPVVVDNKPGAQGVIGVQTMKRGKPDGYTLIISFSGLNSSNPWLFKESRYHYRDDFTHIVPLVRAPSLLMVRASSPFRTPADLIQAAQQNPAKVMYAYGQATSQVMGGAFLKAAAMPPITGVPYRGQPQAMTDLIGGNFDFLFADLSVSKPFVDSGQLRALAISTKTRSDLMPQVPTLEEQGIRGYDLAAWVGLSGPKGMPEEIVKALNREVTRHFATPEVREKIRTLGFTPIQASPAEFLNFVEAEYAQWGRAIRAAGIEPQ